MNEEKTAPQCNETEETASVIADKKAKKKKHTGLLIGGLGATLVAIACVIICVVAANMQTVFGGVSVLGVDMGGMTPEQAEKAWAEHAQAAYDRACIDLTVDGESVCTLSLGELGVSVTDPEASRTAWNACHSGRFFRDGYHLVYSWFAPRTLVPGRLDVDRVALKTAVETNVSQLDFTVVDGAYELMKDGPQGEGLYLTKPRDGKLIDTDKLTKDLRENLESGDLSGVACDYRQQNAAQIDVQKIYDELHGPVVGARYDHSTGEPTRSHVGVEFDVTAVQAQLDAQSEGSTFLAEAQVEFPEVSTEELEQCMFRDVLGTYTTKVTGSASRIGNVKLAAQNCNGRVYNPGDEFWYNATVGQRTRERGFGEAPAYLLGQTVMEVGGGICQVSSTLYYATLLANLRIVQRYAHQFAPGYITWGCDATVSWNGPDYAFANNTAYPIKIVSAWNNNNLTMTILGTKVDDTYVKMESYTRSSTPYQVEYRYNEALVGQEDVTIQTAYTGYLVETYRCVYDGNDNLLSRTYEAKSNYDKRDAIIETGDYAKVQQLYQQSLAAQ